MKKNIIILFLTLAYIVFIIITAAIFFAEIQFKNAQKLRDRGKYASCESKYNLAMFLNPFNTEYITDAASFFMEKDISEGNKNDIFKRAEELYSRAIALNPYSSENSFLLGVYYLDRYEELGNKEDIALTVKAFKETIRKDPYNFRLNYFICHYLVSLWGDLNYEDRSFTLDRAKFVLRVKPFYGTYIYQEMMYNIGDFKLCVMITPKTWKNYIYLYKYLKNNNLWVYRKEIKDELEMYQKEENPAEYQKDLDAKKTKIKDFKVSGKIEASNAIGPESWVDAEGKSTNGDMYWSGTISGIINTYGGKSTLIIRAKSTSSDGVSPYMIVELDGQLIGEVFVENSTWQDYAFDVETDEGSKVLSISFLNDDYDEESSEDRNLFIGEARIEKR